MTVDEVMDSETYTQDTRNKCFGLTAQSCTSTLRPGFVLCSDHSKVFYGHRHSVNSEVALNLCRAVWQSISEAETFNVDLHEQVETHAQEEEGKGEGTEDGESTRYRYRSPDDLHGLLIGRTSRTPSEDERG